MTKVSFIGETLLTNTKEVDDFLKGREQTFDYFYVCTPEFFKIENLTYYNVRVRIYARAKYGQGIAAH